MWGLICYNIGFNPTTIYGFIMKKIDKTDDSIGYASTSYENMNYDANFGLVTEMVYDAYM